MPEELIKKIAEFVRLKLQNEPTGHDWFHTKRVWEMTKKLQAKEGGDLELIELSAIMHDLGDTSQYEFDKIKGSLILRGMMDVLAIDPERQEKILSVIESAKYKGVDTVKPKTIEGKIIQDADYLDALGAIGIARTFATGGRIKRILHDPNRKPRRKLNWNDISYKKQEGTSYNYFFEKAFNLLDLINTPTAREIAQKRVEFLRKYLEEFDSEWKGEK